MAGKTANGEPRSAADVGLRLTLAVGAAGLRILSALFRHAGERHVCRQWQDHHHQRQT
jgi:hypothetical protein